MSLFPAYAADKADQKSRGEPLEGIGTDNKKHEDWLKNVSFDKTQALHGEMVKKAARSKKKRKKNESPKESKKSRKEENNDIFFKDNRGSKMNFIIPELMRDDVPKYKKPKSIRRQKVIIQKRYFEQIAIFERNDADDVKVIIPKMDENPEIQDILTFNSSEHETETFERDLIKSTAVYNERLRDEPRNVSLWMEFSDFQDERHNFEHHYRNESGSSLKTVTYERKLAILNKALSLNPTSGALLREKYRIESEIRPSDQMREELRELLENGEISNTAVYRRQLILVTQFSLTHCNVTNVILLYIAANNDVNSEKLSPEKRENALLGLYLECGLFLRQCDLWEFLIALVRLQLQINLKGGTQTGRINIDAPLLEDEIRKAEDDLIRANGSDSVEKLWIGVESLRQAHHWFPLATVDGETNDEIDPQRVVTTSDVSELVQPFVTSNLRLAIVSLILLKVPPLPGTHSCFKLTGLGDIPNHADSIEFLLSAYYNPIVNYNGRKDGSLDCAKNLSYQPGFVSLSETKEAANGRYLDFCWKMFKETASRLATLEEESTILAWWFRFETWLAAIGAQPDYRRKRLKAMSKEIFKQGRHGSNAPLYAEYALLEYRLNGAESCLKILKAAMSGLPDESVQLVGFSRIYCQICYLANKKLEGGKILSKLAKDATDSAEAIDDYFRVKTSDILRDQEFLGGELTLGRCMAPIVSEGKLEWVRCHAWWLFLTRSASHAIPFLESCIRNLPSFEDDDDDSNDRGIGVSCRLFMADYCAELWSEDLIWMLRSYCHETKSLYSIFQRHLHECLRRFPNNVYFLQTVVQMEECSSSPWWKIEGCLYEADSHSSKIALILATRARFYTLEKLSASAEMGGGTVSNVAVKNRMKNLLGKLTRDSRYKRSPLIWSIYLQFAAKYENEAAREDIFHSAVESCPWVKMLYTEGGRILPKELPRIQEILMEKELRLHITLEELEILKSQ